MFKYINSSKSTCRYPYVHCCIPATLEEGRACVYRAGAHCLSLSVCMHRFTLIVLWQGMEFLCIDICVTRVLTYVPVCTCTNGFTQLWSLFSPGTEPGLRGLQMDGGGCWGREELPVLLTIPSA